MLSLYSIGILESGYSEKTREITLTSKKIMKRRAIVSIAANLLLFLSINQQVINNTAKI
jgi:hypothetical protein